MSDLATQFRKELIVLNDAAQRAARTALMLNHQHAEALKMMAIFTARLVDEDGPDPAVRH